jgi:NADH-quinone oxidoreductase subunit J
VLEIILFISLAILSVFSAIMMVTRRSPINSAIYLILNFLTIAGFFLLLKAQFLAVIQVLVYMGAIMVLFLFVIMLLNMQDEKKLSEQLTYKKISAVLISILMFCLLGYTVYYGFMGKYDTPKQDPVNMGTVENLGKELIMNYSFPFEVAAFLLLAAIVGAVVLAKKKFE